MAAGSYRPTSGLHTLHASYPSPSEAEAIASPPGHTQQQQLAQGQTQLPGVGLALVPFGRLKSNTASSFSSRL